MGRVSMVTRTINSTKVVALCLDTETAEPCNKTYQVSGTYPDDPKGNEKLLRAVKKVAETETFKIVSIVSKEVIEQLYGMTEQKFLEHADILPARK